MCLPRFSIRCWIFNLEKFLIIHKNIFATYDNLFKKIISSFREKLYGIGKKKKRSGFRENRKVQV